MILLANGEGAPGITTTARLLADGADALDAIEAGIRLVEADQNVRSVGPGSWPNILGALGEEPCGCRDSWGAFAVGEEDHGSSSSWR